ncbi:MAG: type IX secretion system membrane protein PorP/SprF [Chitinophagales bacterium]|nr:type IX secretion system membrane protein PorP/SprF [Chitinophagales bacterium]
MIRVGGTLGCLLVFLFGVNKLFAQAEPQYTQFMYNRYLFNPAYSGSNNAVEFALLHRSQYVGLSSTFIATQAFNFSSAIPSANSGIGLNVVNDLIGYQRSTGITINYNYRHKFKWGNMAIGLGGGIIQTALDGGKLRTPQGNYTSGVNHQDNILPDVLQNGVAPDFSFGLYFNNEKYFAGAAINHIILSEAGITSANGGKTKLIYSRNLFFSGGYNFKLSNKLELMPSALVKTDLVKVQAELAATFTIIDNILTGISFRGYTKKTVDALALVLGARYKGFQVVYSYDANLSYLTKFNTGSHEISVSYRYPIKKKEIRGYFYHNPRFN